MSSSNSFQRRRTPFAGLAPAVVALTFSAAAIGAAPPDIPALRAGLWEATSAAPNNSQPRPAVTRLCLDKQTQRQVLEQLALAMPGMCSRNQYSMRGGRFVTDSLCTLGASTIEGKTETTFLRDTAYRTEVVGRVGPAGRVAETQRTVIDARHVGSCPAGMKAGDMVLPNGLTLNIVQLSAVLGR